MTLTITDSLGCQSQVTQTITSFHPKADFSTIDPLKCGIFKVDFKDKSSAYLATYRWNYGDGSFSTTPQDHQYIYKRDGIYDVTLFVKDSNGCTDSMTKTSFIKLIRPKADFGVLDSSLCAPVSINFRDSSTYALQYSWDFGERGPGLKTRHASHVYSSPGIYQVKFVIESYNSCKDSVTKSIRIKGPDGKLTTGPSLGCAPYSIGWK